MAMLQYRALAFISFSLFRNSVVLPLSLLINVIGPLFSVSLAVVLWLRRAPNAGLFALGWVVPHAVSVQDFLRIHGVLPYSAIEQWILPLSLGSTLVCLTSAVMRRGAQDSALVRTDALTGLANRRRFDEVLHDEWNRSRRQGAPLALLMIEVEDFKRYNDTRGHRAGDQCLPDVASVFSGHARRAGIWLRATEARNSPCSSPTCPRPMRCAWPSASALPWKGPADMTGATDARGPTGAASR